MRSVGWWVGQVLLFLAIWAFLPIPIVLLGGTALVAASGAISFAVAIAVFVLAWRNSNRP